MPIEIVVFIAILVAVFAIAIASQVIGPTKLRRRFTEEMQRRGWAVVTPDSDGDWAPFAELAAHGAVGPDAKFEYDVERGLAREKGTIRQRQKAAPAAAFRDPAAPHPRFVAAGSRTQVETHAYQVAGLSNRPTSWSKAHELWVGEARRLPVKEPRMVFSSLHEIGRGMPELTANPAAMGLPPLLEGDLAERVRALLRERQAVLRFGPTLHVSPTAWVLVSMIEKSMPRLAELLDLAGEIAHVFEGAASTPGRTA